LSNLPTKTIMEVKRKVERYVQDKGERDVWAPTVFAAKPDIKVLYPVPSHTNYEKHSGPVTGISTSPFMRRLFLSCSQDGAVRLYDVQGTRALASFEPGYNEYLQAVLWSPFRPAVFVTVSNAGTVYIYDLLMSK
jgi:WD40 repeat protein